MSLIVDYIIFDFLRICVVVLWDLMRLQNVRVVIADILISDSIVESYIVELYGGSDRSSLDTIIHVTGKNV